MNDIPDKDIFSINGLKKRNHSTHNIDVNPIQIHKKGKNGRKKRSISKTNGNSSLKESIDYSSNDVWTKEKLIDELVYRLGSIGDKYYKHAEWLIYRINVWNPTPEFIINKSDLTDRLKKEITDLSSSAPTDLNEVMTDTVRRILEAINPRYYHLSGIHGKVRWRLQP